MSHTFPTAMVFVLEFDDGNDDLLAFVGSSTASSHDDDFDDDDDSFLGAAAAAASTTAGDGETVASDSRYRSRILAVQQRIGVRCCVARQYASKGVFPEQVLGSPVGLGR
jgi:hypothetical protein